MAEVVGVQHFVRRLVFVSLGSPYNSLRDCVPARPVDYWLIAAVEPGDILDTTLLAEQQKLRFPAVCTEKAFQGDSSYRQPYLCFLKDC